MTDTDWLELCHAAVTDVERVLAEMPTRAERERVLGTGEGGDETTAIDQAAEDAIIERFRSTGASIVSEEVGVLAGSETLIVIDPIDGSLNAKRGIPFFSLSIAVASGGTMDDVHFGFVHDFGSGEEWTGRRGEGAWLNGTRLDPSLEERRGRDGRLEVLGIESADPRWVAESIGALRESAYRLRALGTIASSLCQVAGARLDGMVSLRRARGVDSAAGQLIVREAGGVVSFPSYANPLGAPLDGEPASPVVAARSLETLRELERIPA